MGFLPQVRNLLSAWTIDRALRERTGLADADARLRAAAARLACDSSLRSADDYETAFQEFVGLGGGTLDDRAPEVLHDLDANLDPSRSCSGLSGGELARIRLASVLLSRFDALLLDDPTNDLDESGLALLKQFVVLRPEPMLLVSHDRLFLAETITKVIEFDRALDRVTCFDGGYDAWCREREATHREAVKQDEHYADDVTVVRRQAADARRRSTAGVRSAERAFFGGRADKLQCNAMTEGATSEGSTARRAERQLEQLEKPDQVRKVWQLQLTLPFLGGRGGSITLDHALVRACDFALGPIDLAIDPEKG